MHEISFAATDDADWSEAMEFFDDLTGLPLIEMAQNAARLEVRNGCSTILSATTEDGSIGRPQDHQIAWRIPAARMRGLAGRTYSVGAVMEDGDGQITQLFIGTLTVIDGGLS